ncbi:helix-turn-helix domain-containing protein [Saccharothrix sp. NRRL B-16314]|uniref:helix-turn-helix domain-containing protein n=1 Tax=Saccharothrix sp. NRRL B-16314 TaxID=1463825 RepID=UPI0012DDCC09|nr:helix-turn-helix transcriptional regulator [Saccharothrix sp. NRRL B-16314]
MTSPDDQPPTSVPGPTLRSRLLGAELRRVREAAGLTVPEFAALVGQEPDTVRRQEGGVSARLPDLASPEPEVRCPWGTLATGVVNALCRNANRIDIFAPLGIHPALERLGPDRCTAYVLEDAVVYRHDVAVRLIRRGAGLYPGIEHHPLTRFRLPAGLAVVLYPYVHAAHFTEEQAHLLAADRLFEELAEFTGTTYPA